MMNPPDIDPPDDLDDPEMYVFWLNQLGTHLPVAWSGPDYAPRFNEDHEPELTMEIPTGSGQIHVARYDPFADCAVVTDPAGRERWWRQETEITDQ